MIDEIIYLGKLKTWSIFKDRLTRDHPLLYLFWECTLRCNFFCKHCGSNADRKGDEKELSTSEIKETLKSISKDFNPKDIMIAITGGEPLLRSDLFEVMEYASGLGFRWGMVTNGFLVNEKTVEKMKKAGMGTVVVSIDGIGKTHDRFRGVDGAFNRAIEAVKLLAKEDFLSDLQITTSVHPEALDQLEQMYETFLPLGINSWRLINIDPIGRAENSEVLLNKKGYVKLLDFIKKKRKKSKIDITYGCSGFLGPRYEGKVRKNFFFCRTGISIGSILNNGDIYVCPNVPRVPELIQGNVRKDRFSDVWNNKFEFFRDKKRTECEECRKCSEWDNCLGGSLHDFDFKNKKPKLCQYKFIYGDE
jgi:radical SAM protein with 4Fe4S-binding SPASM domain